MKKGILKSVLCTGLSLMMAAGGVFVGAAPKDQSRLNAVEKTEYKENVEKKVVNKKISTKSSSRAIINESSKEWTPQIDCDSKTDKIVAQNRNDENLTNWIVDSVNQNKDMTVHVKMPKAGTLYIDFINVNSDGKGRYADVKLYKGNGTSGQCLLQKTAAGGRFVYDNAARGSYTMVLKCNQVDLGYGFVYPYYVTSEDIGLSTSFKCVVGTGKKITQTFSIKSRRQVWIDSDKAGTGYIEQKVKNQWKKVSDNNYFYTSKQDYVIKSYYALSSGTYRFVMQPSKGTIVNARYGSKTYSTSYATKKSKAKQIKRKKSVTNVLTASDKNKTTHYYKIKLTKKGNIKIDISAYQTGGKMVFTLYGNGIKSKSITLKNSKKGGYTGTNLRKGTYYIKVSKSTTTTNGTYTIKYTK